MRSERCQKPVEVRQSVRFDACDVETGARHLDVQPHSVHRQALQKHWFPIEAVLRGDDHFQFARNRAADSVPHVVEIRELERQLGSRLRLELKVDVPAARFGEERS